MNYKGKKNHLIKKILHDDDYISKKKIKNQIKKKTKDFTQLIRNNI